MGEVVVQKLRKEVDSGLQMGIIYFGVLSALNNLQLSKRQIQLLAFTAVRGTITPLSARKEFVELFNSSLNSIENIKGKLVKKGLMVEIKGRYRVNPAIQLDFSSNLVLQLTLSKNSGTA